MNHCCSGAFGSVVAGTQIRLASGGSRTVEELVAGDQLLGSDGQPVRVVCAPLSRAVDTAFELQLADGTTLTVSADHPLTFRWSAEPKLNVQDGKATIDYHFVQCGKLQQGRIERAMAAGESEEDARKALQAAFDQARAQAESDENTAPAALLPGSLFELPAAVAAQADTFQLLSSFATSARVAGEQGAALKSLHSLPAADRSFHSVSVSAASGLDDIDGRFALADGTLTHASREVTNAWYESGDLLVAQRDIDAGEEIFYDYGQQLDAMRAKARQHEAVA